jgi:hypothetical protein
MAIENRPYYGSNLPWRNILFTAGIAFLAPYIIRRVLPLLRRDPMGVSAGDVSLAGKDAVRDAADDLEIGGVSGKVNRTIDRVTDRLRH